jgi:hypothetical protein
MLLATLDYPSPSTPADGAKVKPGEVTLGAQVIRNPVHKGSKYVFEIECNNGEKETSAPIDAVQGVAKWTPRMQAVAGKSYNWRVIAIDGSWKGPGATATFRGEGG